MEHKIYNYNTGIGTLKEQEQHWKEGYNYPITAILSLLRVSTSWIKQTLLKKINYVVYAPNFVYKRSNSKALTYIKKEDLAGWIMANASYEVQTEFVDLAYYLNQYKGICSEVIHMYRSEKEYLNSRDYAHPIAPGFVPNKVLSYIRTELNIIGVDGNCPNQKRGKFPWREVEHFNIFDRLNDLYTLKDTDREGITREMVYRKAFENGDIKIKLSSQITLFVKNNTNIRNYKIPYLVPYGKKIKVLGRKG